MANRVHLEHPLTRSRNTAGVLGIFLGPLGVHRFYLGYTAIGIVQIVATILTVGFAGFWGIIEGIFILCHQFNYDADGNALVE